MSQSLNPNHYKTYIKTLKTLVEIVAEDFPNKSYEDEKDLEEIHRLLSNLLLRR